MDLSAVAGSPAYLALQTLAATGGAQTAPASSAPAVAPASKDDDSSAAAALAGRHAAGQGLAHALSAADAAGGAGRSVLGLLARMRTSAAAAADPALATSEREALDQDFQSAAAAIAPTLGSATVGDANLVDGSLPGGLKVSLGDNAQISLNGLDLTPDGSTLALTGASLATPDTAQAAQATVEAASAAATAGLDSLQSQATGVATHAALVQSFDPAVAAPPMDDGGDGARLLALQVSQQLGAQPATSIANAAPSQVLSLLRG